MKQTLLVAALVASASAFAPVSRCVRSVLFAKIIVDERLQCVVVQSLIEAIMTGM